MRQHVNVVGRVHQDDWEGAWCRRPPNDEGLQGKYIFLNLLFCLYLGSTSLVFVCIEDGAKSPKLKQNIAGSKKNLLIQGLRLGGQLHRHRRPNCYEPLVHHRRCGHHRLPTQRVHHVSIFIFSLKFSYEICVLFLIANPKSSSASWNWNRFWVFQVD